MLNAMQAELGAQMTTKASTGFQARNLSMPNHNLLKSGFTSLVAWQYDNSSIGSSCMEGVAELHRQLVYLCAPRDAWTERKV